MKIFFRLGIPFGVLMGVFQFFKFGLLASIVGGIFSGSVFGLIMMLFLKMSQHHFEKIENDIVEDEKILYSSVANYNTKFNSIGGWLMLTPSKLLFVSHDWNFQESRHETPIDQINKIDKKKLFMLITNGISVTDANGDRKNFIVSEPKLWEKQINQLVH